MVYVKYGKLREKSRFEKILLKLIKRKTALFSMIFLLLVMFISIFGGYFAQDVYETHTEIKLENPSLEHPLGTDELGRDTLARIIQGGKISLSISLASVAIALVLGSVLGLSSGYIGGKVDALLSMIIEAICAFPQVLIGLLLAAIMGGGGAINVMFAIGISEAPHFARLIRSMTLSIREREYVESATAAGLNHFEIVFRYILPNLMSVIIVQASMCMASAILSEASLSFLGIGVQAPDASWGALLDVGYDYMKMAPWMSIFPGVAIFLTVLSLNFFGDGLRDALDVKIRTDA